mmetsp:Transcript_23771/g.26379  ORF Transcript_23771/g.26379 Transcript_23771/m.26379 type:complete len:106 (+) Transcript_23771:110-427(+)
MALAGVHKISLRNCIKVTDKGVKHLAGVHTIYLSGTNVTDEGVKALAGVHKISLVECQVTDKGVRALAGAHIIDLRSCYGVDALRKQNRFLYTFRHSKIFEKLFL